MASVPVEILLGLYLGILTGMIPALVAWGLGFGFRYFTGVSIPGFGVVVLAVAIAGVNGGLLALADPNITQSANAPTLVTGILVVTALSLYAHAKGDQMGAAFPKRLTLSNLREKRLSRDVVDLIGGRDEVRIKPIEPVTDMEGYPPLTEDLRASIATVEYSFPVELRVAELEERFAERLRTEFDLADVSVSIDERGRATIAAAPPFSGLSKRVPAGKRAISISALVPTGVARGDEVTLHLPEKTVRGTILSARTGTPDEKGVKSGPSGDKTDADAGSGDESAAESVPEPVAPTTSGGEGRVTVAVTRSDADILLKADRARVVVEARGTNLEYELLSLLRRTGRRFRRLTVRAEGALDGQTLAGANVRETYGVAVLAVRKPTGWQLAPRGSVELATGDELFAVGTNDALDAFAEATA
jgi:hypothetical protein